jgi:multiple sugar transport system substrate-binding protein
MFASSEHKEAAQKFLEFTMGEEGNSFWAEASGYMPGNTAVADEPWVSESKALAAAAEARSNESATPLNVPYYLPEWSSITGTDMLPDWQSVLQGNMTVDDFCAKYATALTEAQERYEEAMK